MTDWNPENPTDLGIWEELEWTQPPPAKKKSLSLKLKKHRKSQEPERFASPEKSLGEYQEAFIPENTKVNTRWAVKNFEDWAAAYNERHEEKCPDGVLLSDDPAEVSLWLQKYVISTKKRSGQPYPPRTIHFLLSGLQRYMREKKEAPFNLFSRDTVVFKQLMTTCDSYYRDLREKGVGASSKATEVLSDDDVELL